MVTHACIMSNPPPPRASCYRLCFKQSRRAECGMCLERVKDRFGILVGCKHEYCLKCIREWRAKVRKGALS